MIFVFYYFPKKLKNMVNDISQAAKTRNRAACSVIAPDHSSDASGSCLDRVMRIVKGEAVIICTL